MTYNKEKDVFYSSEPPYASWVLNSTTYRYEAPVTYPDDGKAYTWNETNKSWEEIS